MVHHSVVRFCMLCCGARLPVYSIEWAAEVPCSVVFLMLLRVRLGHLCSVVLATAYASTKTASAMCVKSDTCSICLAPLWTSSVQSVSTCIASVHSLGTKVNFTHSHLTHTVCRTITTTVHFPQQRPRKCQNSLPFEVFFFEHSH